MSSLKNGLKSLYGSKLGKIIPVLVIAGLVATASAAVFVNYYATGTATAHNNDIRLKIGADNTATCGTTTPCAHITTTGDFATIALNIGNGSSHTPQPETVFTDVLNVTNTGASSRTVNVYVTSATQSGSFYGSLTVFYCTAISTDPTTDSANCGTGYTITGDVSASQAVATAKSLASSGTGYIALAGWALTSGSSLNFNLQIQWA